MGTKRNVLFLMLTSSFVDMQEGIITNPDMPVDKSTNRRATLHRTGKNFIGGGVSSIYRQVLQCVSFKKSAALVTGRNLLTQAQACLKNLKKATSIAMEHVDEEGNPNESGKSQHDIIETVLDEMFTILKGKQSLDDVDGSHDVVALLDVAEDDHTSVAEDCGSSRPPTTTSPKRPTGWVFAGFIAFTDCIDLLNLGDHWKNKKDAGRSTARKSEKAQKDEERSRAIGSSIIAGGKRGIPLPQTLAMIAQLRLQGNHFVLAQSESQLIHLKIEYDCLEKRIERYERRGDSDKLKECEAYADELNSGGHPCQLRRWTKCKRGMNLWYVLNMDQTGVSLSMHSSRTLDLQGARTVPCLVGSTSGNRFTATFTVAANGAKLKPFLIFKGARDGRIATREFPTYACKSQMDLHCQAIAWQDEENLILWVDNILVLHIQQRASGAKVVLFLDRLKAHHTDNMKAKFRQIGVVV